ncbi:MAG: NAD(P)-dependent oxidoreductase, partial [Ectothiorhodospira sp.]
AWQLDAGVQQAASVDALVARCDMITLHLPLNEHTRHLMDADRIGAMRPGTVLLNFARDGIVDEAAVVGALDAGHLHAYVCDFPGNRLKGHDRVIALPHLGASTVEAEENCAIMVADQLRAYLEHGNVRNAVNLPEVHLPRAGEGRLAVINRNRPDMVSQISHILGQNGINIVHMVNESRAGLAYNLIDVEGVIDEEAARGIAGIDGVLRVRVL